MTLTYGHGKPGMLYDQVGHDCGVAPSGLWSWHCSGSYRKNCTFATGSRFSKMCGQPLNLILAKLKLVPGFCTVIVGFLLGLIYYFLNFNC